MKRPYKMEAKNFSDSVREWSYEKFKATFENVYPIDELNRVAVDLGIKVKSSRVKEIEPKSEE